MYFRLYDDVISDHKPRLLHVAKQLKSSARTRSRGLGHKLCAVIPAAGHYTNLHTHHVSMTDEIVKEVK